MGVGRKRLGAVGESLAALHYERLGFAVLDRNWRCATGELDLVVGLDGLVVFVEVKSRSSAAFGHPAEAVTRDKQRRIRRLAVQWLAANDVRAATIRFDVVAVLGGRLEVVADAF
jgi:putative endonuclease